MTFRFFFPSGCGAGGKFLPLPRFSSNFQPSRLIELDDVRIFEFLHDLKPGEILNAPLQLSTWKSREWSTCCLVLGVGVGSSQHFKHWPGASLGILLEMTPALPTQIDSDFRRSFHGLLYLPFSYRGSGYLP